MMTWLIFIENNVWVIVQSAVQILTHLTHTATQGTRCSSGSHFTDEKMNVFREQASCWGHLEMESIYEFRETVSTWYRIHLPMPSLCVRIWKQRPQLSAGLWHLFQCRGLRYSGEEGKQPKGFILFRRIAFWGKEAAGRSVCGIVSGSW